MKGVLIMAETNDRTVTLNVVNSGKTHVLIRLHADHIEYENPGGLSGSVPGSTCGSLARVAGMFPNATFEIIDWRIRI
jgi:hypothetical protein